MNKNNQSLPLEVLDNQGIEKRTHHMINLKIDRSGCSSLILSNIVISHDFLLDINLVTHGFVTLHLIAISKQNINFSFNSQSSIMTSQRLYHLKDLRN